MAGKAILKHHFKWYPPCGLIGSNGPPKTKGLCFVWLISVTGRLIQVSYKQLLSRESLTKVPSVVKAAVTQHLAIALHSLGECTGNRAVWFSDRWEKWAHLVSWALQDRALFSKLKHETGIKSQVSTWIKILVGRAVYSEDRLGGGLYLSDESDWAATRPKRIKQFLTFWYNTGKEERKQNSRWQRLSKGREKSKVRKDDCQGLSGWGESKRDLEGGPSLVQHNVEFHLWLLLLPLSSDTPLEALFKIDT